MNGYDYDLLVIGGGGSGGFTAATTAMKSGAKVAMAEADSLGGLCIQAGCMPSKTILHHAAQVKASHANPKAAYPAILAHKRQVVATLVGFREKAVAAKQELGLEIIWGRGSFEGPHEVWVGPRLVRADQIVIATGSREMVPSLPGLGQAGFLVADGFLEMEALPASLVVLGGGAIALELAQFAARMGVATSLVQRGPHLLSKDPPAVGEVLRQALEEDGVRVFTGTQLLRVEARPSGKRVVFAQDGQERAVEGQEILLALGRVPNLEGLKLETAGVRVEHGAPVLDEFLRTSQPHIYAAGDVTGQAMIVNLAVVHGEVAGYNATHPDSPRPLDARVMPRAVFTDPQYASVGLSAAQAQAQGIEFAEAQHDLPPLGVARTYPSPLKGFMTMRAEKATGRLLGGELVAPEAALMIHDLAVALKLNGAARDLADIPYIHPSLAEITNFTAERLASRLAG